MSEKNDYENSLIEKDNEISDIKSCNEKYLKIIEKLNAEKKVLINESIGNSRFPVVHEKKSINDLKDTVDIIICVHNALDDVKRCLDSVLCYLKPTVRLIIVDDGSDDQTKKYLEEFFLNNPSVLVRHDVALGYTKAANAGLRISSAEYVVLLNSDTIVTPKWLEKLIQCAASDLNIGIVGPLSNTASWQSVPFVLNEKGDWADNSLPKDFTIDQYAEEIGDISPQIYPRVGFINGFCFLIKRKVITDLGLFDELFFASGYGEENDYCLRAADNGWQLAIADDCYVYHAQSKSYSHDRRMQLSKMADDSLRRKHDNQKIEMGLLVTRFHPALNYMRKRCSAIPDIFKIKCEIKKNFSEKKLLFLLPSFYAGGGGNIILLEAQQMINCGVDVHVLNLKENREQFEKFHPQNTVPVIYIESPDELEKVGLEFDAVIATLFLTVFWLEALSKTKNPPVMGYYIQDFEPLFFEKGTTNNELALKSYAAIPDIKIFTKTQWNEEIIKKEMNLKAQAIGASVNIDAFYPSSIVKSAVMPLKIVAMVRPSTPHRAPIVTMRVLRYLEKKYGDRLQIVIFGFDPGDPESVFFPDDFNYRCMGMLDLNGTRMVLSQADIFIDCSTYQAMGLTAMEALAAGATIIGPSNGGLGEVVTHMHNGLLVDTTNEGAIVEAASLLIEDEQLRAKLRRNSADVVSHHPLVSACNILKFLFPDQDNLGV